MSTNADISHDPTVEEWPLAVRFIARQAILKRDRSLYGYELLYRGEGGLGAFEDPDTATRQVVADGMLTHGLDQLTRNHRAFVNFTRDTLITSEPGLLPCDRVVIEILEDVEPDAEVLAACARLKKAGYLVALDDVTSCARVRMFADVVGIVKVDMPLASPEEQARLVDCCREVGAAPLAEKVETYEDFERASRMGYKYFQGFFFGKPETLSNTAIPGSKVGYLRVLETVNTQEFQADDVTRAIKSESAMCLLLLRYMNSAFFSFANKVESIQHAVALLGDREIRKWVSLLALSAMSEGKPTELAVTSLVRAAWSESLELEAVADRESRFLVGLLSLADAVMDRPMFQVLEQLALSPDLALALAERKGQLGDLLRMLEAYEHGHWDEVTRLANLLGTEADDVAACYLNALGWARRVFSVAV